MPSSTQARPRVVVTNWVHDEVLSLLRERCDVVANQTPEALGRDAVIERARDAEGLLAFMPDRIDAEFLDACPALRVIGCAAKGIDNFDADACAARGVWLTAVDDLLTEPTAELAIGLTVSLMRHVPAGDRLVRDGRFNGWRPILYGATLSGMTVGIVGFGAVGRAVARRLDAFGARLIFADPAVDGDAFDGITATRVPFETLMGTSGAVIVAAPLTPSTRHLVDATAIGSMRPGAFIANVGRGSVVDEDAVAAALRDGRLAGYAADVFGFEDWALDDRPRTIPQSLLDQRDRTLFTPHLGSAVDGVRREIALAAAASILDALDGRRPRGAVNAPRDVSSAEDARSG